MSSLGVYLWKGDAIITNYVIIRLIDVNFRPTMIKYGIDNIRELCGNKINLKMVQENPICRLDK